jgi:ATPase subunit of ABC transporter with duplicated ATPase domains
LTRDLTIVDNYGIRRCAARYPWIEWTKLYGLKEPLPLDVIDAIRKVNAISMPSGRPPAIRPRLSGEHSSGTLVLRAQNVTIGYPRHALFTIHNLELRRGECAALIGPNGSGKTTFLKVLLEQLEPLKGELRPGASLKIGYFAQAHDGLDGDRSVLDELLSRKEMDNERRNHWRSTCSAARTSSTGQRAPGGERAAWR